MQIPLEPICAEIRQALAAIERCSAEQLEAQGPTNIGLRLEVAAHRLHRAAETLRAIARQIIEHEFIQEHS